MILDVPIAHIADKAHVSIDGFIADRCLDNIYDVDGHRMYVIVFDDCIGRLASAYSTVDEMFASLGDLYNDEDFHVVNYTDKCWYAEQQNKADEALFD